MKLFLQFLFLPFVCSLWAGVEEDLGEEKLITVEACPQQNTLPSQYIFKGSEIGVVGESDTCLCCLTKTGTDLSGKKQHVNACSFAGIAEMRYGDQEGYSWKLCGQFCFQSDNRSMSIGHKGNICYFTEDRDMGMNCFCLPYQRFPEDHSNYPWCAARCGQALGDGDAPTACSFGSFCYPNGCNFLCIDCGRCPEEVGKDLYVGPKCLRCMGTRTSDGSEWKNCGCYYIENESSYKLRCCFVPIASSDRGARPPESVTMKE